MDEQKQYIYWILKLVLRNKERAREVYYLISGFLGNSA